MRVRFDSPDCVGFSRPAREPYMPTKGMLAALEARAKGRMPEGIDAFRLRQRGLVDARGLTVRGAAVMLRERLKRRARHG